jgi:hypothetical protein
MRLGIFIGDARGLRTDLEALLANAGAAERLGFATGWVPHIPWSLDGLVAVALAGQVTDRIELGTAEVATRLRAFADAGATDLAASVLGLDDDREGSAQGTREVLAGLIAELA